jgi:phosphoribosylformimino-5-aminoimidazole carboxamide ribotide isomerase
LGVPVQFGGGMRSLEDIGQALKQGAARVIIGTLAIRQPEIVAQAVERWGAESVCVALDARDGKVAVEGWQEVTEVTPLELSRSMVEIGLRHALFTDVGRDGRMAGVNLESTIALGRDSGLQVIASGGVSTLEDIEWLRDSEVVAGAIIGTALYTGRLALADAIAVSEGTA